jgi:hypothetical protein
VILSSATGLSAASVYTASEMANALPRSAAALRTSFATSIASPIAISIGGSDAPISPIAAWPPWMLTVIFIRLSGWRPSRLFRSAITPSIAPAARSAACAALAPPSWPNSAQMLSNST